MVETSSNAFGDTIGAPSLIVTQIMFEQDDDSQSHTVGTENNFVTAATKFGQQTPSLSCSMHAMELEQSEVQYTYRVGHKLLLYHLGIVAKQSQWRFQFALASTDLLSHVFLSPPSS